MMDTSFYTIVSISLLIGAIQSESVTWNESDWNSIINDYADHTCEPSYDRSMADPAFPDRCPDGYPDEAAGLCYEACPDGWTSDGVATCYEDCQDGYDLVVGTTICSSDTWTVIPQGSKGRGAGVIPNSCGSGKTNEAGLCYNTCPSGWTGILCHCWRGLEAQGRGCGVVPQECPSSHPLKQTGLCYKACPAGYPIAEGPVCWESCDNYAPDAKDTGLFCEHGEIKTYLQKSFLRKSKGMECSNGELSGVNCYEKCKPGFHGELHVCWNENLDNAIASVILTSAEMPLVQACYATIASYSLYIAEGLKRTDIENVDFDPFIKCAWPVLQTMDALDDSWDSNNGVTVAVTASITGSAPVVGVNAYGGVAFEFKDVDNVEIWAFTGGCTQVGNGDGYSVGIDSGMAIFRDVDAIDGFSTYLSMGLNFFDIVDASSAWAFDDKCEILGMSTTVGVSCGTSGCVNPAEPVSFSVATGQCINFHRESLGSLKSPATNSAAKTVGFNALPGTPALIALEASRASNENEYCCQSKTVDGWNGNWNGICWGLRAKNDCEAHGIECHWDHDNCRSELTCSLRDMECMSDEECCSGRCKMDDQLCR